MAIDVTFTTDGLSPGCHHTSLPNDEIWKMATGEYTYQSDLAMTPMQAENPMERRLTSILAADMVGYSRLMAFDEEGVIRRLRWVRANIIYPTLAEHGGRIVRIMGDGLLVDFSSPMAAVLAAISIQQTLASLDIAEVHERRLRYRIGLNQGDVVVDGDDLLGDCVNVAARLEGIAPIGGICLSRTVYDQILGQVDVPMAALGAQRLKNIPEPVEVWQIDLDCIITTAVFGKEKLTSACE